MAKQLRAGSTIKRLIDTLRLPSRYAQIGLICAVLLNLVVIGLDWLGSHYLIATLVATAIVTVIGFLLHCAYTYRVAPSVPAFVRFVGTIAVGSCVSLASMVVLCDGFGLNAAMAIPIATLFLFLLNYLTATWAIAHGSTRGSDE